MEDHLFVLRCRLKHQDKPPLLGSIRLILQDVLQHMLEDLKKYYNPEETNLVYLTIHQPGMVNALNSGAFSLQHDTTDKILSFALNLFNSFVNSQAEVKLNEGFQVYFKVLSYAHYQDPNHRRKTQLARTLGCKTDDFNMTGCVEVPDGFPANKTAFVNKCLLTSVILSYYCNEYYRTKFIVNESKRKKVDCTISTDETYLHLMPLYTKRKRSLIQFNQAGYLMIEIMDKIIEDLGLDNEGPYEVDSVCLSLANYFNCQIHLLKSCQEKEVLIQSFPETEWPNNLSPIFLYPKTEHHVVSIINLKSFCQKNRQFCFICKITFKRNYRHFCRFYEKSCFRCKSYYATEETIIYPNLPFTYCFSKINPEQLLKDPIICLLCQYKFPTQQCYDNHRSECGKNKATKSKMGVLCSKCNKFHNNKQKATCTETGQKKCRQCKEIYSNEENDHLCLLQKETLTESWPKHIFFDFEFENISPFNCTKCFELKNNYLLEKQIDIKEALKCNQFLEIKCAHHANFSHNLTPNFCTVWKETDYGTFDRITFASDDLNVNTFQLEEVLQFNYDVHSINPANFRNKLKRKRVRTETTNFMQNSNIKKENKTVLDYFAIFLLKNSWQNYVFISLNHKTDNMSCILEIFSSLNLAPQVIRKGNRHIILNCESEGLLFLNASNYFKGSYEDISKQFNLNISPIYFPTKLNLPENSEFVGSIPTIEHFYDMMDTEEEKLSKEDFVKSFSNCEWSFKEQLAKASNYKTEILAKACVKFLKATIDFQVEFKQNLNIQTSLILHPFNRQVCTSQALSYKMFSNYCLNNEIVYSVLHESTSNMKKISQSEYEFVTFYELHKPKEKFQHAFSSKEGQKKFGPYDVDLYSPISKTIYQLSGCLVHLHDLNVCLDPNRKKMKQNDLSIYGKSKTELDLHEDKFFDFVITHFPEEVKEVKVMYECIWKKFKKESEDWKDFANSGLFIKNRPLYRLVPRIAMRSGLVDQYRLKWLKKENPNEIFKIADVNLLYSHVAINEKFPVGKPVVLIGQELDKVETTEEGIFFNGTKLLSGSVHCSVLAPSNEEFPFLQFRISNKFSYLALCKACALTLSETCRHRSNESKKFTSVWTLPDLNKALKENYIIYEIFEIIYFPDRKPILKTFVQALVSQRIKNSGGLDNLLTVEEKQAYCDLHNREMNLSDNFKLTIENVTNNPGQKQFYKDLLNAIFGKFSSNLEKKRTEIVRSQRQLENISQTYEITELFPINDTNLLVEYELNELKPNFKGNIFIGSEITAHARIYMHDYLRKLQAIDGVKIFSIETDCIMYSIPKHVIDPLPFSDLIGQFKNVIPITSEVQSYFALGSKNYSVLYKDSKKQFHTILKVKGLSLKSAHVENLLSTSTYDDYIESHFKNELKHITFPQLRKTFNKKSNQTETRFQTFEFRNDLFLKRYVESATNNDGNYKTLPFGYKNN